MSIILKQALEHETFVLCYFESSSHKWIGLKVEPARHLIRMDINAVSSRIERFEDKCSDPDLEWLANLPLNDQIKNLRASIQGNSWMWDPYYDPYEFCHWPK